MTTVDVRRGRPAKTVRGILDVTALSRAPQMFDQSAATVVSELLQNARRAGATAVDVSVVGPASDEIVVFEDDGCGVEDFRNLVTFGRSGWDDAAPDEDWAGMGVFALASRGCKVSSRGRSVDITPEVFIGRASASPVPAPYRHGTRIEFPVSGPDMRSGTLRDVDQLRLALRHEAFYCPMAVTLDGERVTQRPFLEHATQVVTIEGVRVGFYDEKSRILRDVRKELSFFTPARRKAGKVTGRTTHAPMALAISFGGHVVKADLMQDSPASEWTALAEIGDGARIRLKLPTRDGVILDEAFSAFLTAVRLESIRLSATRGSRRLSMKEVAFARGHGIDIADPPIVLSHFLSWSKLSVGDAGWSREEDRLREVTRREPMPAGILVPTAWPPGACHAVFAATRKMDPPPPLFWEDPHLEGLPSYDAMPRLVAVHVRVVDADRDAHDLDDFHEFSEFDPTVDGEDNYPGEQQFLDLVEAALKRGRGGRALSIKVVMVCTSTGSMEPVEVPAIFARNGDEELGFKPILVSALANPRELEAIPGDVLGFSFVRNAWGDPHPEDPEQVEEQRHYHGVCLEDIADHVELTCSNGARVHLRNVLNKVNYAVRRAEEGRKYPVLSRVTIKVDRRKRCIVVTGVNEDGRTAVRVIRLSDKTHAVPFQEKIA